MIVGKGKTLVNCLAYIDLNPIRAGIVDRPEDYRWNSIGYHLQTENKDQFLSTDFGLKEFNPPSADKGFKNKKERIRRYRRYVYEAGEINRADKMQAQVINDKVVAKERKKDFEISRVNRFRYRTRYFTDSGIIGSKKFNDIAATFVKSVRWSVIFYQKALFITPPSTLIAAPVVADASGLTR